MYVEPQLMFSTTLPENHGPIEPGAIPSRSIQNHGFSWGFTITLTNHDNEFNNWELVELHRHSLYNM
jgi:hypothetical protein